MKRLIWIALAAVVIALAGCMDNEVTNIVHLWGEETEEVEDAQAADPVLQ